MEKVFGILLLWILSSSTFVDAFTLNRVVQHKTSTTLFVSQPLPEDESPVFGRPLAEDTKEFNKKIVYGIKTAIFDNFFAEQSIERSFARFWALETVARMPYFSYLSILHLYETLGWWRRSDYLKIHFLQGWNEQHHLLIMEELQGNSKWSDRFLAEHMAVGYYFFAIALYLYNPTYAYNFNQVIEEEAFDTYDRFLASNEEFLKGQPAPQAAKHYYLEDDLFLLMGSGRPRPTMESLYDTFCAIRTDEGEHAETMVAMQKEGL
jgi:ubiquinol oxidase